MSDRIHYQDRNPDAWSIRSALELLSADDVENISERDILLKYQDTLRQLNQKEQELHGIRELLHNIHAGNNENYLAAKKGLQESASRIVAQVDTLDRNLRDLQEDPNLKPVIAREKEKERQRQEQKYKEALERRRKKDEQTQRELMERYEKSRQEARQRIEQNQEQVKQETISEALKEEPKVEAPKKTNLMNLVTSIGILLLVWGPLLFIMIGGFIWLDGGFGGTIMESLFPALVLGFVTAFTTIIVVGNLFRDRPIIWWISSIALGITVVILNMCQAYNASAVIVGACGVAACVLVVVKWIQNL